MKKAELGNRLVAKVQRGLVEINRLHPLRQQHDHLERKEAAAWVTQPPSEPSSEIQVCTK